MTLLSAFGLFAVTAMLIPYALEDRSDLVCSGICILMPAGLDLWMPSGRVAIRIGWGSVVRNCSEAVVVEKS